MRIATFLSLTVMGVTLGACATEDPGIDPATDRFYFPIGLALDPVDPVLYVGNSNADLRFNGGTITALDLSALPADLNQIAARVKDGTLDCAPSRTDVTSWECKESQFIQPGATIRIGHFPSALQVTADGKRIFAAVRGEERYLLWAEIARWKEKGAGGKAITKLDLRCNRERCNPTATGNCDEWDCDTVHKVGRSEELLKDIPREPFGILLNELVAVHVQADGARRTCRDGLTQNDQACGGDAQCAKDHRCVRAFGRCSAVSCGCGAGERACQDEDDTDCCVAAPARDHVYVAHLAGGEISLFTSETTQVVFRDYRGGFFTASNGVAGGYDIAAQTPGDALGRVYASSRVDSVIGSFVVRNDQWIVDTTRASVQAVYPATDVRGLAFAPGGEQLYLANREPSTLVALDMTLKDGVPRHESLWAEEVCAEPARVRMGVGPRGELMAFVACFSAGYIYVVDPARAMVVGQIATGKGPYDLVLDTGNRRAFVANFLENTIGVIDLDPSHVTYLKMLMRIGLAEKLVKDNA